MDKLTEREEEILKILKSDPMIPQEELAVLVGITRSAVAVHISNLIRKGFILGRGYVFNDRTGVLVAGPVYADVRAVPGKGRQDSAAVTMHPGGAGYLMAEGMAAHNIPVSLAGVIGRDDWGTLIGDKLKKKGIDTRSMIIQGDWPTPSRVELADPVDRRCIRDTRALAQLNQESLQKLGAAISSCRMLVADTDIPSQTFDYILELAMETQTQACVRFAGEFGESRPDSWTAVFGGLYMAVMPGDLAQRCSGTRVRDLESAAGSGARINSMGVEIVVVFIPGQGAALTARGHTVTLPVTPVQGEGTAGSPAEIMGAALTSGLVSGILLGYDYRQSMRLALGSIGRQSW